MRHRRRTTTSEAQAPSMLQEFTGFPPRSAPTNACPATCRFMHACMSECHKALTACSVAVGVSCLNHKALNDSMEQHVIVVAIARMHSEVFDRLGAFCPKQLHTNIPKGSVQSRRRSHALGRSNCRGPTGSCDRSSSRAHPSGREHSVSNKPSGTPELRTRITRTNPKP